MGTILHTTGTALALLIVVAGVLMVIGRRNPAASILGAVLALALLLGPFLAWIDGGIARLLGGDGAGVLVALLALLAVAGMGIARFVGRRRKLQASMRPRGSVKRRVEKGG